jgi:hypothetical protein
VTRYWTCRKCATRHPRTKQKCPCGVARPPARKPKHMTALDATYEDYIALNGGEHCGICGRKPSARRRLDRDHDHTGAGSPRGLLCSRCNRALPRHITIEWLRAAAAYLARAETLEAPGVRAVTPHVERRAA